VAARIPDLAALGPLVKQALPPVTSVTFDSVVKDADGGLSKGMALYGMRLTSSAGDLAGDVGAGFGTPKLVTAVLTSSRIDLDALRASPPAGPSSQPPAAEPSPTQTPAASRGNRIFSDQPLPFDQLKAANADIRLAVATLRYGAADYKAVDLHLALQSGKLRLDPFKAELPEGHVEGVAEVDAGQAVPPVALRLRAPGMAVQPLLAAMGQPAYVSGKLEVQADLRGAGQSPHAIAASLSGPIGLAMANGTVDNRLLGSTLGKVMQQVNALDLVGKGGASDLRCLAVRLDFQGGTGTFRTLALSSTLATVHGDGSVNLGDETLALRLVPQGRVGGTSFVVPVKVAGPIRAPAVAMDPAALEGNAGNVAAAMLGGAKPLDALGGLLGGGKAGSGGGDACAGPLAIARGQSAPAATPTAAPGEPQHRQAEPRPKAPDPGAVLRQLFR
jgi:AsmA protein